MDRVGAPPPHRPTELPVRALQRTRLLALAAVVAALLSCTANRPGTGGAAAPAVPVFDGAGCGSVDTGWGFQAGVTHTEHSIGTGADLGAPPAAPEALAGARRLLQSVGPLQNMHIFGFGELKPPRAPAGGPFDWTAMDARMRLICSTGGTPVITLCCSPSWATDHYDPAAPNDDTHLYQAPLPSHYQDYADMAVAIAQHYPFVQYFQVWNEFKGFYGVPGPGGTTDYSRWDYQGYTAFYNTVFRALDGYRRGARRTLRIGGPYIPTPTWYDPAAAGHPATDPALRGQPWGTLDQRPLDAFTYWLDHKAGADFLIVDGGTDTEPDCPPGQPDCPADQKYRHFPSPADGDAKLRAVNAWLWARMTDPSHPDRRVLPIWWSELYAPVDGSNAGTTDAYRSALAALAGSGASVALMWGPEYQPNTAGSCHQASGHLECTDGFPALWTRPTPTGGGEPPPGPDYLTVMQEFAGPHSP